MEYLIQLLSAHEALFDQAIGHSHRRYVGDIVATRDNLVQLSRGRRALEFPGCINNALLEIAEEHSGTVGGQAYRVLCANRIGSASSSLRSIGQRFAPPREAASLDATLAAGDFIQYQM